MISSAHLIVEKLKIIFSGKLASRLCFIISIVFKISLTYYFLQFDTDKIHQASAAKNLVEGNGLTITQVHVSDLSRETHESLTGWPPGYSLLVASLYYVIKDLWWSCFIIDILAILLFFTVFRKLLSIFSFPPWLINLLMVFNGLTITDSIVLGAPTDLLAMALSLLACLLAISVLKEKNSQYRLTLALALVNALPSLLRYMYIPSAFVIPLFLIFYRRGQHKYVVRTGFIALLTAFVAIGTSSVFQYLHSGSPVYFLPSQKGIFWSNLFWLHPVVFSTFINVDFWGVQLSLHTGISYTTWMTVLKAINFPLFLVLIFLFVRYSVRRYPITNTSWHAFVVIFGSIGLCILGVLAYLSLRNSHHIPLPFLQYWTFISDGRYFIGISLFILIVVARWLFLHFPIDSTMKKCLRFLFLMLLAADISHGIYFLAKNFTLDRRNNKAEVLQEKLLTFLKKVIDDNRKQHRNVVVANYTYLVNHSVLLGEKGLFHPRELNSPEIYASKPTLLIVPLESFQFSFYRPFLSKKGVRLAAKIDKYYIYYYYIMPDDRR